MIQAVIFDMDGTLIDSEPLWKAAEKQVFSSVGVEVNEELSVETASMTTREVTAFWYSHFPWSGISLAEVESAVIERVAALISEKGKPMEGVKEILDFFQKKKIKIGLSTNAPARLIPVVLQKLGIAGYFDAISSSEFEIKGKPDPAVYLTTAKKLEVEPSKCIAFEDSLSGIIAASRANIKTILVSAKADLTDSKYEISHMTLRRFSDFNDAHIDNMLNFASDASYQNTIE